MPYYLLISSYLYHKFCACLTFHAGPGTALAQSEGEDVQDMEIEDEEDMEVEDEEEEEPVTVPDSIEDADTVRSSKLAGINSGSHCSPML